MLSFKQKNILGLSFIAIVFLFVSFLVESNTEKISLFMEDYLIYGILLYILIGIIVTVIAPLTSVPLIPLAANLWGWFYAGIYSILGWFIGSLIAFWVARKFGKPLIQKIVSLDKLNEIEKYIPKNKQFWLLTLLRILLPVDILTYALGLFTNVSFFLFFFSTLIGITPFAFIYAYLGILPLMYQLVGWVVILIIVYFLLKSLHKVVD